MHACVHACMHDGLNCDWKRLSVYYEEKILGRLGILIGRAESCLETCIFLIQEYAHVTGFTPPNSNYVTMGSPRFSVEFCLCSIVSWDKSNCLNYWSMYCVALKHCRQ